MFIIAIDFGTKSIGIAIGQKITYTANPLTTIKYKNKIIFWKKIKNILEKWKPIFIIIGLPLNIDGSMQTITKKAIKFSKEIKSKFNIDVKLQDERLTTIEAKSIIFKQKGFKHLKKNKIDSMSAVIILESWLNKQRKNKK
ncbi:Holliday junction resolvase RuvX [Buchnera aphidicola (Neophyllaphis podocarpi)]|uniref:Holliday junction resolvase RuvX n=1 Tax=Buchnera aphidicola TaxID=9 RepID=UPI0031B7EFDA